MRVLWRGGVVAGAVAVVVALLGTMFVYVASQRVIGVHYAGIPSHIRAASGTDAVREGARLVHAYGCTGCHNEDLQGGYDGYMAVTVANLTRASETFSDTDFDRAIRQGIAPDGTSLTQEMPSNAFRHISDAVLSDMIAYIRAQPHGGDTTPRADRPLGERWALLRGHGGMVRQHFDGRIAVDLGKHFAQGRQIAMSVCAMCHGAALTGDGDQLHLSVPSPDLTIVAAYDRADFIRLLRTGKGAGNREVGVMSDVARQNLHYLSDSEITALYDYLVARGQTLNGGG